MDIVKVRLTPKSGIIKGELLIIINHKKEHDSQIWINKKLKLICATSVSEHQSKLIR